MDLCTHIRMPSSAYVLMFSRSPKMKSGSRGAKLTWFGRRCGLAARADARTKIPSALTSEHSQHKSQHPEMCSSTKSKRQDCSKPVVIENLALHLDPRHLLVAGSARTRH